jgi:hypothetical protein
MSFARSAEKYFHKPDVHKLLQGVADQDSLVIYVGAGASIDRTGLSWRGLVTRLLEDHIGDKSERQFITNAYTTMEAASVACEMELEKHGRRKNDMIREKVRKLLYAEQVWQRGNIMTALVELAAQFASDGKETHIITTNYDDYLEKEIKILRQALGKSQPVIPGFDVKVVKHNHRNSRNFDIDQEVAKYTAPNSLVYVHGRVPERGGGDEAPVLSEVDYIGSQRLTSAILVKLFKSKSVLVVGSSLTDPPLLDALAKTPHSKSEEKSGKRKRVAVMPLQGINLPESLPGGREGEKLIEQYWGKAEIRMRQFDIEGTFPDFYGQVAQFLTEVRVCTDIRSSGISYHESDKRYGKRLTDWWSAWYAGRRGGVGVDESVARENLAQSQVRHHETLRAAVEEIGTILGVDESEKLKIEVWLRWDPDNRQLKVWASSTGTWADIDITHSADIAANSSYASVRAFCVGRPQIYKTENESHRWPTHLCVPLVTGKGTNYELPVGVISLASMLMSADQNASGISKIGTWNGRLVEEAVLKLREVGLSLVTA